MCLNVNQRHCIQRNGHSTCFNPGSTGERFDEPTAIHVVVEGKKTHVMVMWCATNPGEVFAGYFHACTTMIKRWKGSWVAVLGFHTDDPALARCSVKELMSCRDTWWATFPVQREGEKRSPRFMQDPNVESRHQLVTVRMHHEQGFAKKNLSKARFSTFQVLQSKDT